MKRLGWVVLLAVVPRVALAGQTGGDVEALMAEVDRDFAAAQAGDCAIACKALDSMRRAAEHLCELDAGDRCARARQRVHDAAERVRSSCPDCAQPMGPAPAGGAAQPSSPPSPPAEPAGQSKSADTVAQEEAGPRKGGGCAGCSVAARSDGLDHAVGIGIGGLALLAACRRRRRTGFR